MPPEIHDALEVSGKTAVRAFERVHAFLVEDSGCVSSMRSGQVAFSMGDELVAVACPVDEAIELLLALPLDASDPHLFDAVDYKWRSLPAGVRVANARTANVAMKRAETAVERVRSGEVIETPGESYARVSGVYDPAFKRSHRRRFKR